MSEGLFDTFIPKVAGLYCPLCEGEMFYISLEGDITTPVMCLTNDCSLYRIGLSQTAVEELNNLIKRGLN